MKMLTKEQLQTLLAFADRGFSTIVANISQQAAQPLEKSIEIEKISNIAALVFNAVKEELARLEEVKEEVKEEVAADK